MALKTNSSFSIRQKFVAPLKALAKKNSNPVSNLVLRTAEELRGKLELFELPLKPESSWIYLDLVEKHCWDGLC